MRGEGLFAVTCTTYWKKLEPRVAHPTWTTWTTDSKGIMYCFPGPVYMCTPPAMTSRTRHADATFDRVDDVEGLSHR